MLPSHKSCDGTGSYDGCTTVFKYDRSIVRSSTVFYSSSKHHGQWNQLSSVHRTTIFVRLSHGPSSGRTENRDMHRLKTRLKTRLTTKRSN